MSEGNPITPKTAVSLPLIVLIPALVALVGGALAAGRWMSSLDWTLRSQGERLAAIDAKVSQFTPAAVRDEARRVSREVLDKVSLGCSCVRVQGANRLTCQCKAAREERDAE